MADMKKYNPVYANHTDALDEYGHEVPDPTPVEVPTSLGQPPSLADQVLAVLRSERFREETLGDRETFEEADDFDVGDGEYLPFSPHELSLDQELYGEAVSPPPPPSPAPPPAPVAGSDDDQSTP